MYKKKFRFTLNPNPWPLLLTLTLEPLSLTFDPHLWLWPLTLTLTRDPRFRDADKAGNLSCFHLARIKLINLLRIKIQIISAVLKAHFNQASSKKKEIWLDSKENL